MSWAWLIDILFDGPVSWLWPLAVLPPLSAFLCRRASRLLPPTHADWRVAAVLAGAPGFIMLLLLVMALGRGILHFHLDGLDHFIEYHLVWVLALPVLCPAILKSRSRSRRLRLVTAMSTSPGARLEAAGAAVGIEVRELPLSTPECFVAGTWRPIAYLSTAAVARLSDTELRAALHHERSHCEGADPALYAILSFLVDVVRSSDEAMRAYREARERRADAGAVAHVGPLPLASALLALARPHPAAIVGMSGGNAAWRLAAILALEPEAAPRAPPARLVAVLMANGTMALWPAAQAGLAFLLCNS